MLWSVVEEIFWSFTHGKVSIPQCTFTPLQVKAIKNDLSKNIEVEEEEEEIEEKMYWKKQK